mmetsp:Transcript_34260/g.50370  ORF Transcript_34260/g.50370 Transcript_34260/m.50370 type:complete len:165 (+) Transcript_34260:67-561(+)|eukprot:CAMPEP_0195522240 /NCGR_PEP_ID=MMETSP0794_2-20130614/20186_1 /TAXON_ID=515487 /ORGANISM="Stephanopyxis turris, Strain CCMP 815" /LENGTH=164 /DNA_ID=CAMNT_0040651947 /DNA_START=66 /DNA_END=560 /DNA_ORIENTATION=+
MPKNARLSDAHVFGVQTRKFGSPGQATLCLAFWIPIVLFVALAAIVDPVAVPTCYTTDRWEWHNLPCINQSNFSLSDLYLSNRAQCSCELEAGYKYYIGGPSNVMECGLSLCVYLERQNSQGYLFQTCAWEDETGGTTTVTAHALPDDNGIFLDQANTDIMCEA